MGDVDSATIRVERSVEETKAGLRVKSPKTKRGRRNIALPPDAIAILRAHKVKTLELRLALGMGNITPETWIFSTIEGELLSPDNLSRDWRRISTAKKLPRVSLSCFAPYQRLRAHQQGRRLLTISRRLGHSKPSVTLDVYGHLIEGTDAVAAQALAGVLGTPVEQ
jgi:integrase